MDNRPLVRLIHQLARSGGTIFCRCVATMRSVALLSEIHPLGTAWFDPLDQARRWFKLVSEEEAKSLRSGTMDFPAAIELVRRRAQARGRNLVVRDWAHLDFTGVPYLQNPSFRLLIAESLSHGTEVLQVALVRHPLDQLLSLSKLRDMQECLDVPAVLQGYRKFAEEARRVGFVRYEDFVNEPDAVLRQACDRLCLPFDATYAKRWARYNKITGDQTRKKEGSISAPPKRDVDAALLAQVEASADYRATLESLGYSHPAPASVAREPQPAASQPDPVQQWFDEANALCQRKDWKTAVSLYHRVLEVQSGHEWALNNIGYCLVSQGLADQAVGYLQRALALNPDNRMALANMVMACGDTDDRFETIPFRRRLVRLEPTNVTQAFGLAGALLSAGRADEAIFYYRKVLASAPNHKAAASNYLLALNYSDNSSSEFIAMEHFRLAHRWRAKGTVSEDPDSARNGTGKLTIGYLSGDYAIHPVGKIIQPILAAHNKSDFKIVAYSDRSSADALTEQIARSCDLFRDVSSMSDEALLAQIKQDGIDILVELTGHTGGRNRLGVLAARPVPIQVAFLGYPNTTGLPEIDFRLTDAICDPLGVTDELHSEELVRLERGFLCYRPPRNLPPSTESPVFQNGYLTFGYFNNPSKASETAMSAWASILRSLPSSRLKAKYLKRFESECLREQWCAHFASKGVDPGRIDFCAVASSTHGHLEAFATVDIALDPFPYQGTFTTLETLAAGVPLVTMMGQTYSRRASSALLLRVGLRDLVARTPEDYVRLAVALARRPRRLRQLRSTIRERFLRSAVCDVAGYVAEMENVYRSLWSRWCSRNSQGERTSSLRSG